MRRGQVKLSLRVWRISFAGQKYGDPGYQQRLGQALDDGIQQGAQICLRVEASTEVNESLPVIEALLLEDAVDPRLNGSFEWIEDDSRNDDSGQPSVDGEAL